MEGVGVGGRPMGSVGAAKRPLACVGGSQKARGGAWGLWEKS